MVGLTRGDFSTAADLPGREVAGSGRKTQRENHRAGGASGVSIVSVGPASAATPGLADIIWHNVGKAELKFNSQELNISGLEGYQGQPPRNAVLTNDLAPKRLSGKRTSVPCLARKNMVLAEVQLASHRSPPGSPQELWPLKLPRPIAPALSSYGARTVKVCSHCWQWDL